LKYLVLNHLKKSVAMQPKTQPEYWLRGPIAGIPALLQPVAHALLQARKEVLEMMDGFPESQLWETPAGAASPAFHLQHMAGVIDRLLTYARAEMPDDEQLNYLQAEGRPEPGLTLSLLLENFCEAVEIALRQLAHTNPDQLTEQRGVGRAQLPATLIGLLVHMAEHTMRHTGQLLVTVKVLHG
jgi:uncharacterized damage-inducible protein DinB